MEVKCEVYPLDNPLLMGDPNWMSYRGKELLRFDNMIKGASKQRQ